MGRQTKPKEQFVKLSPQGKGRHKVFSVVERRVDLSRRGSASAAAALRKERRARAKLPSQQSKHGVDYSKPLPKDEAEKPAAK